MRTLSSSPLSSSSIPPSSSVSFFERYEKIFNGCGGCIADDEQEPVASAILYQQSNDETDAQQQSAQPNEAISNCNWSSSNKAQKQQESPPPVGTVLLNQPTSYDNIDKFDIEERQPKRQQSKTTQAAKAKAHTEAIAVNEYFNGRRNSNQPEIQMAIQRSPTTTMLTQQQRRRQQQQQHCHHATSITSNTNAIPFSPKTSKQPLSSPPKTRLQQYDMFQVVMPRSFRSSLTGPAGQQHRHHAGSWKDTHDSDSTQSTQSLSESDDDDLSWDLEENEEQQPPLQEQEQDIPVSILRRKFKFETRADTTITEKNRVRRVRFEQDTKFLDTNVVPSSTRKPVPRMSPKQKQEYMYMMHTYYQPITTDRQRQRQLDVSSLLMEAAAGPSSHTIPDEFRDYSMTATKNSPTNNMMCSRHHESDYRQEQRLTRRAQQKQYHHHHPHQRSHSSATAEELLLSHYYTPNNQ